MSAPKTCNDAFLKEINELKTLFFSCNPKERRRFERLLGSLEDADDAGIDALAQAVADGTLAPHLALRFLAEMRRQSLAVRGLERLVALPGFCRNDPDACRMLIKMLHGYGAPSSPAALVALGERRLAELQTHVRKARRGADARYLAEGFRDIETLVRALETFTHPDGVRNAERLFRATQGARRTIAKDLKKRSPKLRLIARRPAPPKAPRGRKIYTEMFLEAKLRRAFRAPKHPESWAFIRALRREEDRSRFLGVVYKHFANVANGSIGLCRTVQAFLRTPFHSPPDSAIFFFVLVLFRTEPTVRNQKHLRRLLNASAWTKTAASTLFLAEYARRIAERAKSDEVKRMIFRDVYALLVSIGEERDEARHLADLLVLAYPHLLPATAKRRSCWRASASPAARQRSAWRHRRLFVAGPALLASMCGRGERGVTEVDLVAILAHPPLQPLPPAVFPTCEDAAGILSAPELEKLRAWLATHRLERVPLRVTGHRGSLSPAFIEGIAGWADPPLLLLWDEERNERLAHSRRLAKELRAYRDGTLFSNVKGVYAPALAHSPTALQANANLASALRTERIAKTLALPSDAQDAILVAENAARSGALIATAIPPQNIDGELLLAPVANPGAIALDDEALRTLRERRAAKEFSRICPRLAQIAEEVALVGSIDSFIRHRYGEAYLYKRGFVQLFDIRLARSPAPPEQQRAFLKTWAEEDIEAASFLLRGEIGEKGECVALPEPHNLDGLIDPRLLEKAEDLRAKRPPVADAIAGAYELSVVPADDEKRRKAKLRQLLAVLGAPNDLKTIASGTMRTAKALARLGVDPRNPMLRQFDNTASRTLTLVVTNRSRDMLHASVGKPWKSCIELKLGAYQDSLYEDIGGRSLVAYLLDGDRFVARSIIRVGFSLEIFAPAAYIEDPFGDDRYEDILQDALCVLLERAGIATGVPFITYPFKRNTVYIGSSFRLTDQSNLIYDGRR